MGEFLTNRFVTGSPVASVPADFYNDVDEVLTNLEMYNGHIERNGNFWTIIYDVGEGGGTGGGPHRFRAVSSSTKGSADVELGGWNQNGTIVTDSAGAIGSVASPFIIATITQGTAKPMVPSGVTVSAAAAAPADSNFATVRTIAKINHDTDGNVSSITRYQIGDVYQPLGAIQSGGSWTDGGKTGTGFTMITDIQYDDSAHKLQYKKRTCEVRSGTTYIGQEDSTWTDITTALACP